MSENGKRGEDGPGTGVVVKAKPKTKKPSMYKVLMLNDDYTPMEFVLDAIEQFFDMDRESAMRLMLRVHNEGIAECGTYSYEIAKAKATQVVAFAREHRHPLQCVIELKW